MQEALLWSVIAYCSSNALFTVVMGNAFAAFPIMTAAIGWPVLVENFDGNPTAIIMLVSITIMMRVFAF